MHALIVVSHPNPASLTHAVADRLVSAIRSGGPGHSAEPVDLAAEGFDPRFTANDVAVSLRQAPPEEAILREQARIDRADLLLLVYPIYWWSFPALLKGWIDRVFITGWAYDETQAGVVKKLHHLPIHLIGLGAADLRTYARHGYFGAMRTQIDHGIFDYCGAPVITTELLLSEAGTDAMLERATEIGRSLFERTSKRTAAGARLGGPAEALG
ncbi:NAD(P)H-dependent oxidoreductase [Sphingomonas sp. NSE70-1]|uniref:NAD(P)H-dependent oxidoreductase n=1 Tax=Sphingomonas caseinilyticus TaxID=2908205 RepID=A0ABT0RRE4_9SPHN|nr:NAD(P)H-dependent oxidoreductase [Sphingomonas caseinilyticus]MCL6697577.1 NAD(P)H-dependent oxidoreductase [Sphingomonas caseinilyticus]